MQFLSKKLDYYYLHIDICVLIDQDIVAKAR